MYKNGFGINNLQWLICHKSPPNQTNQFNIICWHTIELLNRYFLPIHETLTGTTTQGQLGTGSNTNEEVLHIL